MNTKGFERKLEYCLSKLNKETDLDWSEIRDELGLDCSHDHLRKLSYAYKEYSDYIQAKGIDNISNDMYNKLIEKELDIKKQMTKLSDMRVVVNKETRNNSRVDHLIDCIKENIDNLNNNYPLINNEVFKKVVDEDIKEALLLCSDWHLGADFTNMVNDYNLDIAKQRINYLVNRTIEKCKKEDVRRLHLTCIGDLINGLIHNTVRIENRESVSEQVSILAEILSEVLARLSKEFSIVTLSMTSSNHERIFQDKKENTAKDSFHFFTKELIKLRCKDLNNVVIRDNELDESFSSINICGNLVIASHGDLDKKGASTSRYAQLLGYVPDIICLGHHHSPYECIEGKTQIIGNGSMMGSNEYAVGLRLYSQAMQKLLIFSNSYGLESVSSIRFKDKVDT